VKIELSEAILVCLFVFGVAWVIADSKISVPFRRAEVFGEDSFVLALLECPPCLSFWLGLFSGLGLGLGLASVALGFVSTAFSVIAWTFVSREDSK
jgi:hypothetical protein